MKISRLQKDILKALAGQAISTQTALSDVVGSTQPAVSRSLKSLMELGCVIKDEAKKYTLLPKLQNAAIDFDTCSYSDLADIISTEPLQAILSALSEDHETGILTHLVDSSNPYHWDIHSSQSLMSGGSTWAGRSPSGDFTLSAVNALKADSLALANTQRKNASGEEAD